MTPKLLSIIIPAYNEAKNIPIVLPGIIDFCKQQNYQLILVNDGSSDDSKTALASFSDESNLTVIHHKINRGYGGAIKSGIEACQTEYLVTMDCDGQHLVEDVKKLLEELLATDADMVVGSRKGLKSASISRSFGKTAIRFVIKRLMPLPIYDINSGMKLYKADLGKRYAKICPNSMAYSDVICLAFINKFHRVIESPISIKERQMGQSSVNIKTAFHTIYEIFNIIVLFNPIRIFMPVALASIVAGILWEIPIFMKGNGVSVGAMLFIMLGVLTLFFAAIAEQLSQIRKRDL
ncbi:glycosyltransferase family 2 protein [Mucilaginibacter sp. HMF5004]|uniref:glycosyltransferase family 2 protein n=1 Tax=Mucilaginibacter rivuli TaxID=2857527 RepID=UPI001C5ED817|nr:glycosyltransferase family 2 protein [Mucilaginibacter rivuli]MBW4889822.1 glycosyltransferase family 2 protein [Mucilaginibacter rivuli]